MGAELYNVKIVVYRIKLHNGKTILSVHLFICLWLAVEAVFHLIPFDKNYYNFNTTVITMFSYFN